MITREYLETRLRELVAARDKHLADVEANNGAIQFCQHLLKNLVAEPDPEATQAGEQPKPNGEVSPEA